ncbi:SurA N-terminal domain-containing protein [Rhizobium sp. NRK18]|jgi:peptidyl-prolyl cis-trans isomerase SurA|uniref:SurA N-terminal domain-containing protein n=1 Tax=Rhizobium sp. NRK18 TaxID=2964667 RepID=UPI0021C37300|nr:SurA N-terminal domain-containing protein [Rhizobium sp. NRK18]
MRFVRQAFSAMALSLAALTLSFTVQSTIRPAYAASSVEVVVNDEVITSGDVARRVAFLKLQHKKGNLKKMALQDMIDQVLKRQEILRVKMSVSTADVDAAYERFAAGNKMSTAQLDKILQQAGVGKEHFKAYIAVSMSWGRVVRARYGQSEGLSQDELIQKLQETKQKPVTTEYVLKQIIFVVPESRRNAILSKRKAEAEAARARFPGCDQAKVFAATMLDVAVKDLGRFMLQELPPDWKPLIEKASNGTTGTRVTDRGVEFLAICSERQVSDDKAAEVVFREQKQEAMSKNKGEDPNDAKYIEELRKKARIVYP